MILLISTCQEPLHELEFVKPVALLLERIPVSFTVKRYSKVTKKDLALASKVIICGTSLQDNAYLEHIHDFSWLKTFLKPVLGICAGMQALGLLFGSELKKHLEIGVTSVNFKQSFLGLTGKQAVYALHSNALIPSSDFIVVASSKQVVQAIKHKKHPFYGTLFHPEVMNKELVQYFIRLP